MVNLINITVPTEKIRYQSNNVEADVANENLGKGTVYITEDVITWINSSSSEGFHIQYTKMTLHAISRDELIYPTACIYIMVNGDLMKNDEEAPEEEEDDEDDEEVKMTEIRLVPDDKSILEELYRIIQECSLLHPGSGSEMSDSDSETTANRHFCEEEGDHSYDFLDDPEQVARASRRFEELLNHGYQNQNNESNNGIIEQQQREQSPYDPEQFADAEEDVEDPNTNTNGSNGQ